MKAGIILGSLALVALLGAVAVTTGYGGFFSSVVTSPKADRPETRTSSAAPSRQPDVQQPGAIQPVPPPPAAQLPPPAPPAPLANDSASSAKTASASDKTGRVPSAQAGGRRVAAEDILVPDENGAKRTALSAEEKAAIARGLKELGITESGRTTVNARSAPQSEQAATAELNRKALAGTLAEEARAQQQAQAQNRQ